MKRQPKKADAPRGRPKRFAARKNILIALNSHLIDWLDARALQSGVSRTELIEALLVTCGALEGWEHLKIGDGGLVGFRAIAQPEVVKQQALAGMYDEPNDEYPLWFGASKPAKEAVEQIKAAKKLGRPAVSRLNPALPKSVSDLIVLEIPE